MTRESNLWATFKAALPAGTHAVRIENCVELGTPDVNLCIPGGFCGWVELKVAVAPKRATTLFKIAHFTMEQRQWLVERCRAGGKACLLLQVGRMYLWIRGDVAAVFVDFCTFHDLCNHAEWHGLSLDALVERLVV